MPSAPATVVSAVLNAVQGTMNRIKDAAGLPRSVRVLGVVRACPILVGLCAMGLVVIGVLMLQ